MRFAISYSPEGIGYRVSVPNYNGGEVVTADEFDALLEMARELRLGLRVMTTAWKSHDPSVIDPSGEGAEIVGECEHDIARFDEAYPPEPYPSLRSR